MEQEGSLTARRVKEEPSGETSEEGPETSRFLVDEGGEEEERTEGSEVGENGAREQEIEGSEGVMGVKKWNKGAEMVEEEIQADIGVIECKYEKQNLESEITILEDQVAKQRNELKIIEKNNLSERDQDKIIIKSLQRYNFILQYSENRLLKSKLSDIQKRNHDEI